MPVVSVADRNVQHVGGTVARRQQHLDNVIVHGVRCQHGHTDTSRRAGQKGGGGEGQWGEINEPPAAKPRSNLNIWKVRDKPRRLYEVLATRARLVGS